MANEVLQQSLDTNYEHGFVTDVETETFPPGLSEQTIRNISAKKNEPEFMLQWRLDAFRAWQDMQEPHWAELEYEPIDYQAISYFSAPKSAFNNNKSRGGGKRNPYQGPCRPASPKTWQATDITRMMVADELQSSFTPLSFHRFTEQGGLCARFYQ